MIKPCGHWDLVPEPIADKRALAALRRGYVLNIRSRTVFIHRFGCVLVRLMNPVRGVKGGVFQAGSLEEASAWAVSRGLKPAFCRLCLGVLLRKPLPSRIVPEPVKST